MGAKETFFGQFPGTLNDSEYNYYNNYVGGGQKTLHDAAHAYLDAKGIPWGQLHDRWYRYWQSLGYSGTFNDLADQFWTNAPSLDVDLTLGVLPASMTFTRASNATQFDSVGKLVWAPHNHCAYANKFDSWSSLGADGTISQAGTYTKDGNRAWILSYAASPTVGLSIIGQSTVVGSKTAMRVKIKRVDWDWVRVAFYSNNNTVNQCRCWVNVNTGALGTVQVSGTASDVSVDTPYFDVDGFLVVTLRGVVPWFNTTDGALLVTSAVADANTARQGNVSLEVAEVLFTLESAASPVWKNTFLTTGSNYYGPRFDYNPSTLAARGIMIEEGRSNLSQYSHITSLPAGGVGTTTSALVNHARGFGYPITSVADGAASQHYFFLGGGGTVTVAASTQYTVSVVIFSSSNDLVQLTTSTSWSDGVNAYVNFRPSTGTITSQGSAIQGTFVQDLGGGIYRVSFVITSLGAPSPASPCIVGHIASATETRLLSNALTGTIVAGCVQVEAGATPTSYIPTYGTSVTRAAETATMPFTTYSSPNSTFVSDSEIFVGTAGRFAACLDDGTISNRWYHLRQADRASGISNLAGVDQAYTEKFGAQTYWTRSKFASTMSTNNFRCAQNGTLGNSDVTGDVSLGLNVMRLGVSPSGAASSYANGWIARVQYYPYAMTNAQLQAVTA